MGSKTFLVIGLVMATVLLTISAQVAAGGQAETETSTVDGKIKQDQSLL